MTRSNNFKFAVFSILVLALMMPSQTLNVAVAADNKGNIDIGRVSDGTYNESLAIQRMTELANQHLKNLKIKHDLENQLATASVAQSDSIKNQLNTLQQEDNDVMKEFNQIQNENQQYYRIDSAVYDKYVLAQDNFVRQIAERYWKNDSTDQNMNAFPLVEIGINHQKKAIEIALHKSVENSKTKNHYLAIITELMPKDIPWFVSYEDYATPTACTARNSLCDPIFGGLQITVGGLHGCTLGFEAKQGTKFGFVTAGHCGYSVPTGATVIEPGSGTRVVGTTGTMVYSNGATCDCMFVANNTSTKLSDKIFQDGGGSYTPLFTLPANQQAGLTVVQSGAISGNTVGQVTSTNVSVTYRNDDGTLTTINNLVRSSIDTDCGDSGSPVTDIGHNYLVGVISGSSGECGTHTQITYHAPMDRITSTLGITPILG
jgi:hypothetical protein